MLTRGGSTRILVAAFACAVGIVALTPAPTHAERTLALSAGSFSFEVDPGEEKTGEVVVINDGDEPIKVLVYSADQLVDEAGEITYNVPDRNDPEFARRPTSWVRLRMPTEAKSIGNTPYLELEPGERIPVSFVFQPPANAAPGDQNVVLFFEMFELAGDAGGAVTQVSGRIGSRLQMRVRGQHTERLSVRPFVVPAFRLGSDIPFSLTIQNTGNLDQRLSTAVILFDRNGVELTREEPLLATLVFAGNNKRLAGVLSPGRQMFGRFSVQAEVYRVDDNGVIVQEVEPLLEQRSVWLVPWWLVVALGAVVIILLGRFAGFVAGKRRKRTNASSTRAERRERRERLRQEAEGSQTEWSDSPGIPHARGVTDGEADEDHR